MNITRMKRNTRSGTTGEFAGHESHRKRLEYNEERDW